MPKRITATAAKNNFGGLLEDVAALGRVEIVRHGRVVAIVLAPHASTHEAGSDEVAAPPWGETHMIPPTLARRARIVRAPAEADDGDS